MVAILIIAGCARVPKITPRPSVEAYIIPSTEILSISKAGITINAKALRDATLSHRVYRYFIPFYVSIRNNLDYKIWFSFQNFILLDEKREQYSVVRPEEVSRTLVETRIDRTWITVGWETTFPDQESAMGLGVYYGFPEVTPTGVVDVFQEGPIYPHAQKSGYIFFPRMIKGKELTMVVFYHDPQTGEESEFHFPFTIS